MQGHVAGPGDGSVPFYELGLSSQAGDAAPLGQRASRGWLLGPKTAAGLGHPRHPTTADVRPSLPTPRDAGLTGGRLRLRINEGRHFPSVSKCGGLLDNLGFAMLG